MHEKLVKLTEEAVAAITKAVQSPETQKLIEQTKAAKDAGTFEVIISTEHEDRMSEVIMQDGWQLERYMKNPVVLWGHDHRQLPIGVATELTITEFDGKPALKARGNFAEHDFAQTVRKLYDAKVIRTTSVGFIPKKFDENDMSIITIAELLEFSFVSVPANPFALSTLSQLDLEQKEIGELFAKGILNIDVKEGEPVETPAEEEVETEPGEEGEENAEEEKQEGGDEEAPAEETETDEEEEKATDAPVEKDKGAVADEAQAQKDREAKWKNFEMVDDVIFSFYKVYMDSETPVDAFKTLLDETIGLLQAVSGDEKALEEAVEKCTFKNGIEVSGMRAVRENAETFKGLDLHTLKSIVLALEALIPAEKEVEPEGGEGEDAGESADDQDPADKDAELALAFLKTRKGVQTIASMASDLLRDARKEAEKHY